MILLRGQGEFYSRLLSAAYYELNTKLGFSYIKLNNLHSMAFKVEETQSSSQILWSQNSESA